MGRLGAGADGVLAYVLFDARKWNAAAAFADRAIGTVDLNVTLSAVGEVIAELDKKHRGSRTAAGKPRAPIGWPELPEQLDWAALPATPGGVNPDPFVAEVIAVAYWVTGLAEAWSAVETIRASREYLANGDVTTRLLPIKLMESPLS